MIIKKFRTQNNIDEFEKIIWEPLPGPRKVDTTGYLTNIQRINNLITAGRRLVAHRASYDFDEHTPLDEEFFDPTRSPGFDLADASQIALEMASRATQSGSIGVTDDKVQDSPPTSPEAGETEQS